MTACLRMEKPARGDERAELTIDGEVLPLTFKRNARARRIILRLDRRGKGVLLTLPVRASRLKALDFAKSHAEWIKSRLAKAHETVTFRPGAFVPLRGQPHLVALTGELRGLVRVRAPDEQRPGLIEIAGNEAHLARRLSDWLKAESRKDLTAASLAYAKSMGVSFRKISVRDQASRWGSCSAAGQLSFSWRLILAPPFVLDYVAAHEVAHLKHMNHGRRFWALVEKHCPACNQARAWMKQNGRQLHRYG
ncbi:MAG TPA: SprT family zinc-dependent metalloprotease [Aestuariivirgaceae bacterium]|jgi:predicted metal-dependent hydrolase